MTLQFVFVWTSKVEDGLLIEMQIFKKIVLPAVLLPSFPYSRCCC